MDPVEIVETDKKTVYCDGGGNLGHPRIYLIINPTQGSIDCPYCGKRYILTSGSSSSQS